MKKLIFLTIGFLIVYLGIAGFSAKGEKHPDVDFAISCVECHAEETPDMVKAWQDGKHGTFKVGCFICHGDGEERFTKQPGDEACITCHSDYEVDWSHTKVQSCFDCHNGHTLKFH